MEVSGQKNPFAKHDHCIYYAPVFWSVSCIFTFPRGTKGEIFKCMLNVCWNVIQHICAVLIGFLIWMYFSRILRCFHLKVILHGFVHFAWNLHAFHLNVIFQIILGVPNLHCILSHFYVEPLVTWHPLTNGFLGKFIEKNRLPRSGVPPLNFLRYK